MWSSSCCINQELLQAYKVFKQIWLILRKQKESVFVSIQEKKNALLNPLAFMSWLLLPFNHQTPRIEVLAQQPMKAKGKRLQEWSSEELLMTAPDRYSGWYYPSCLTGRISRLCEVSAQGQYSLTSRGEATKKQHRSLCLQELILIAAAVGKSTTGRPWRRSTCSFLENGSKIDKNKRTSLFTNQNHPAMKQAESGKGRKTWRWPEVLAQGGCHGRSCGPGRSQALGRPVPPGEGGCLARHSSGDNMKWWA